MTTYLEIPLNGQPITSDGNRLSVPNFPIIPYVTGDGIGIDITPVMLRVVDAAVNKAYGSDKGVAWLKAYAGQEALTHYDGETWLPDETVEAFSSYKVGIKGPLDAPLGSGLQSLSIQLREQLALNSSIYSYQSFEGVPSLLRNSQFIHIDVFQETSDSLTLEEKKSTDDSEIFESISSLTRAKFECLFELAMNYAIANNKKSVTVVHPGGKSPLLNKSMRTWASMMTKEKYGGSQIDCGPWMMINNPNNGEEIIVKEISFDAMLQQVLQSPAEYSVIVAPMTYGASLSSMLSAQTGMIGLVPVTFSSSNVSIFEASHGTAQKYAGQNKVNPTSLLLSAENMLRHIGWNNAADLVNKGIRGAIEAKTVTYDLANKMPGATLVSCSTFGDCIIEHMRGN